MIVPGGMLGMTLATTASVIETPCLGRQLISTEPDDEPARAVHEHGVIILAAGQIACRCCRGVMMRDRSLLST